MEGSRENLKWFGEGFDGFPKHLPEDCVEYMLFIIDEKLTQKEISARLEQVRRASLKLTSSLLKEYIWQRDSFQLTLEIQKDDSLIYLHGLTNHGDSVEDEWLIVFLLRELSRQFSDLWIRVFDTDGEFLLIEAANTLPKWLNPEVADNRVWIHNNELRVIPLSSSTGTSEMTAPLPRSLTLSEARKILSSRADVLIHSPLIEAEAFYRIRNYPAQISDSLHHAQVTISRKLAYIIHEIPTSIAPAVEAFYLRDPIALQPLQQLDSNLVFPPEDLVTTSVRFTKILFAQVKSQQFAAPDVWHPVILEAESRAKSNPSDSKDMALLDVGMKVTSGFEMLVNDPANKDMRSVREIRILLADLADGTALPTNSEMMTWENSSRQDDKKWLDINYEEFEKELQGKKSKNDASQSHSTGPTPSGFGDAKTQEDLKKIVERFESFMNDEDAGIEGAEMDEMDFDDGDDDDNDDAEESEEGEEDKEVSFDAKEFTRMMREMMGMPPEEEFIHGSKGASKSSQQEPSKIVEVNPEDEEDEAEEIRQIMQKMEAELNEAGALDLDPTPAKLAALQCGRSKGKSPEDNSSEVLAEDSEEEVDIDFNLAKNLLESFKSQAGMAGPGGNIMGLMGMRMPLDEDDSQHSKPKE